MRSDDDGSDLDPELTARVGRDLHPQPRGQDRSGGDQHPRQRLPVVRLTVIDQSTTDDTREVLEPIAAADGGSRYVHSTEAGLSRAYNTGIAASSGEVIAFTDDDCIVPPDWLRTIVTAFAADPDGDLLYGQVIPPAGTTTARR